MTILWNVDMTEIILLDYHSAVSNETSVIAIVDGTVVIIITVIMITIINDRMTLSSSLL